jgi:hypothetical protein
MATAIDGRPMPAVIAIYRELFLQGALFRRDVIELAALADEKDALVRRKLLVCLLGNRARLAVRPASGAVGRASVTLNFSKPVPELLGVCDPSDRFHLKASGFNE